jgi:hypothetical protein
MAATLMVCAVQDGITELEEDTRQKLTQTWDAFTASLEEMRSDLTSARTELVQSDSSLMQLVRVLGDKVDVLELTELPEINAQLDDLGLALTQEQESIRQFVEESLEVCPATV